MSQSISYNYPPDHMLYEFEGFSRSVSCIDGDNENKPQAQQSLLEKLKDRILMLFENSAAQEVASVAESGGQVEDRNVSQIEGGGRWAVHS